MKRSTTWILPALLSVLAVGCGSATTGAGGRSGGELPAATVSATVPVNDALSVALNGKITVTFSQAMDPASVTAATFTLAQGTRPVPAAVTSLGAVATMAPASPLVAYTTYTATISTGARDLTGRALAAPFSWIFTTSAGLDAAAPTVSATVPASGSGSAPLNGKLTVTFSEAMAPASLTAATCTLSRGGAPVALVVTSAGAVATLSPTRPLARLTAYTGRISSGARDLAGNALEAPYTWSFTTGATPDTTPPSLVATDPVATGTVATNGTINATFSEAMDPASISVSSFTLSEQGKPVPVAVTSSGPVASMAPVSPLTPGAAYTATLSAAVRDLAGNALAAPASWSFTAGPARDTTPPRVSATDPAGLATEVPIGRSVRATFTKGMEAATLNSATVTLRTGPALVPASVSGAGAVATLVPARPLAAGTTYTATITPGAIDLAGNGLAETFSWSFTTAGVGPETAPPRPAAPALTSAPPPRPASTPRPGTR